MPKQSHFRYFKTSPEIIRLAVMLYIKFPLSLRNVEDLPHQRGIEVSHDVRPDVCRRDPAKTGRQDASLQALALALGRGLREHQRGDALPLARRRS